MSRVTRVWASGVCLLVAVAATGCRSNAPVPLADAAPPSGLTLSAAPDSLVIRPGGSGRLRFVLRDGRNLPISGYVVDFSIVGDGGDGGVAGAQLSTEQALTDSNGAVELEIIVGDLASDNSPVALF